MEQEIRQITALVADLHGYVDRLATQARDIFERATALKDKAEEYDSLCKAVDDKRAELERVRDEHARAARDYEIFKATYMK